MENAAAMDVTLVHSSPGTMATIDVAPTTTTTNDPFYVQPDFPPIVFEISAVFMIVVGIVGVVANFSVIVLFIVSPHVSDVYTMRFITSFYGTYAILNAFKPYRTPSIHYSF